MPDLNRLGAGQYGNAFSRLFFMDDINAVPTLAPEILPTSSLWERDEFWGLINGRLGVTHQTTSAVAAQSGFCVIGNPANSNLLIIIERLIIPTAQVLNWGTSLGAPNPSLTPMLRDLRFASATTGTGGGAAIQSGTVAGNMYSLQTGMMTGPAIVPLSYVLSPATNFVVQGDVVNTALEFTVEWRERPASPSEMSFR